VHAAAGVAALPDSATILIAGPSGGRLDRVATDLLPALMHGLPAGTRLQGDLVGGSDGVTGANQFEARGAPDGGSILLMPGEAALAWLVGDPRAQFKANQLSPIMSGVATGVLLGRYRLEAMPAATRLRIAAARPDGPDLAALLALDLLGLPPDPMFGFPDAATVEQAVLAHEADVAFVAGPDAPGRIERLGRAGLVPLFVLGMPAGDGAVVRDPMLPDVPTLPEMAARLRGSLPSGPLYESWRAVSVSAQLTFLLALPPLTPASLVSLWRQAGVHAVAVVPPAEATGLRMLTGPETIAFVAPMTEATASTLMTLRRWLSARLGWQPA
jgi:hypothetical protein